MPSLGPNGGESFTGNDLIYITQGSSVAVYSSTGEEVGELKGLQDAAKGICSDTQGDVWVTYGGSFLEYAHGGTTPIAQLYLPQGYYATSCAVDPTTNAIAVDEFSDDGHQNIAVYQNIYETPKVYKSSLIREYAYLTFDDQGDLFVNGIRGKRVVFAELPVGGRRLAALSVDKKFNLIGGLQWDGEYLVAGDSGKHVIYQMTVASGRATTASTSHFHGWRPHFKQVVPFAIARGEIVFPFSTTQTGYWEFPQGGRPNVRIDATSTGGIAISAASTRATAISTTASRTGGRTSTRDASWFAPLSSKSPLLYTSAYDGDGGVTGIYSYPEGKLVGQLDVGAQGLCSDGSGNVFLTNRNSVSEYAHGSTKPTAILRIPGSYMYNCAVDPVTRNLAVTMSCYPCGYYNLAIFPKASQPATLYQTGNNASTCSYDGSGNLFVTDSESGDGLRELAYGSGDFTTIMLDEYLSFLNQIQWDGKHLNAPRTEQSGLDISDRNFRLGRARSGAHQIQC